MEAPRAGGPVEELRQVLRKYWGYPDFRPLQPEAMRAVLSKKDSVVVLPTGGGKSLCFQVPALLRPGLAVVICPLISLMKDQVDSLADCGIAAACINSTATYQEKQRVTRDIRSGKLRLLYLSPERLMMDRTLGFLKETNVSFFAIDEAHCISEWGHDFRPEYRMLRALKEQFPTVDVHAYTATATEHVRGDIARELGLDEPEMLVGSFDRTNLIYRVQRRSNLKSQIREILQRHAQESGIIYCLRRADVEQLCADLNRDGYRALPYHAGMSDQDRRHNQEAFLNDRAEIMVATVAFGMGIDKSDVRFVIHAAAPKSLEGYQQESGRAGRDGLEAECCLFYSPADFQTWRKLQQDLPEAAHEIAMTVLAGIDRYCQGVCCRHNSIASYFGQQIGTENCGACDVCLGDVELVEDRLIVAQKILSCVVRLQERFGGDYTTQVLIGSQEVRILANRHNELSTWGLLAAHDRKTVRGWIEQLVGQGYLVSRGEYQTLALTGEGRRVLRGEMTPRLLRPRKSATRKKSKTGISWQGVDIGLFETLRAWRKCKAAARRLPPYIVMGDATLRELARFRPSNIAALQAVSGIGAKKAAEYGAELLATVADYCRLHALEKDVSAALLR